MRDTAFLKYVYPLRNSKEKQRIYRPNPCCLACEQAFWGVPPVGWEKEGELATTSLETNAKFLYLKIMCIRNLVKIQAFWTVKSSVYLDTSFTSN